MAASQQHGFLFEQHILAAGDALRADRGGSISSTKPGSYTARFDLEAEADPTGKSIPTCIKIAKRARNGRIRVDMADARRAMTLAHVPTTRLVIGVYDQVNQVKHVNEVREYLIDGATWKRVAGDIHPDIISQFHQQLAEGDPTEARVFAKARKKELAELHPGTLKWSPKIDSKTQRRLQCSLYLDDLDALIESRPRAAVSIHTSETQAFWGVALPLEIRSAPRMRNVKSED